MAPVDSEDGPKESGERAVGRGKSLPQCLDPRAFGTCAPLQNPRSTTGHTMKTVSTQQNGNDVGLNVQNRITDSQNSPLNDGDMQCNAHQHYNNAIVSRNLREFTFSLNRCIGDDTKAANRQSLNCIKNTHKKIKYGEKRFSICIRNVKFLGNNFWLCLSNLTNS